MSEIERLYDQVSGLEMDAEKMQKKIDRLTAENEMLRAVYEAVLPLHVSGSHIYDLDIKLGKAIDKVRTNQ